MSNALPSLPSFPPGRALLPAGADTKSLMRAGITLVPACDADLPFLQTLYASTRAEELAAAPWPEAMKAAFVNQQFAAQHRHLVSAGSMTDFWIVQRAGLRIGRLYLDAAGPVWRIVDIALMPAARGVGIGAMLLRWTKAAAIGAHAAGVDLHVLATNPRAAGLYARHGFVATGEGGEGGEGSETHRHMICRSLGGSG